MISYLTSFAFGFFAFIGVLVFSFLLWKKAKKKDLDVELIFDWTLISVVSFLIVGRLFYIFENYPIFIVDIFRWIHLVRYPGISGSGGFIGLLLVSVIYFKTKKVAIWEYLDVFVLAFLYGSLFLNIGCFVNQCAEGIVSSFPSFLKFLKIKSFTHPVILYSLIAIIVLIFVFRSIGKANGSKNLRKNFKDEKLPFKTDGLFFLFFLLIFSLENLILAIFTTHALYFKNLNLNFIYFAVLGVISILLFFNKIGLKNLIKIVKGVGKNENESVKKDDKNS